MKKLSFLILLLALCCQVALAGNCREAAGMAADHAAKLALNPDGNGVESGLGSLDDVYELNVPNLSFPLFTEAKAWVVRIGDEVGYTGWVVITQNNENCTILSVTRTAYE